MESSIQLCKKCLLDKKFTIPLIIIKEKSIIYYCPNHNVIPEESDIIDKTIGENIKEKLITCNIHDNPLSAWCTKCKQNICHMCIAGQKPHKHDYTLFSTYIVDILKNKEEINNKITASN